jgi:transposase
MGQKGWFDSLTVKNKAMQKNTCFFLGIDVSKAWFDACLMPLVDHQKQPFVNHRFNNDPKGMTAFGKWLHKNKVSFDENTLAVIENTGLYHRLLWHYCSGHNLPLHIGNAAHIKWSFGITRAKNDRIDSERLCLYAYRHRDELKASPVLDAGLLELKDLLRSRQRLLSQLRSTQVYLKELGRSSALPPEVIKDILQAHKAALQGLARSLELIEQQIKEKVSSRKEIKENYKLLRSVPGIGHITAVYLIGCTTNFAGDRTGKQLASYAGVVPFEQNSGSSIKSRGKVHKMANKELKKLLHMCAVSSIRSKGEFKTYYDRKKGEGKHSMSILNAIRNKIVLRAVAVINRQEKYTDKYKKAA